MKLKQLLNIGQKLYHWRPQKIINYRWLPIFLFRCFIDRKAINTLEKRLNSSKIGKVFFELHTPIWFQLTRQNFHMDSTTDERLSYMLNTWDFFEECLSEEARHSIYCDNSKSFRIWETKIDDKNLFLELNFVDGEIKEGCMTIRLLLDETVVYHMNFWIGSIDKSNKKISAYIGCHQGSKDGLDINRDLTKQLFGCRPKNFVFIALQELLSHLGITELYAVSSEGHYSNKFHGDKRKPKVSYNDFWTECGGTISTDKRFFSIPLHDKRKSMEEIPSKKRSTYRKRYELLDQVSAAIKSSCKNQQPKK